VKVRAVQEPQQQLWVVMAAPADLVELMVVHLTVPLVVVVEHMVVVVVGRTVTGSVGRLAAAQFASFGVLIVHSQVQTPVIYNI
jgi:hypothetical protein